LGGGSRAALSRGVFPRLRDARHGPWESISKTTIPLIRFVKTYTIRIYDED
jgi:hypothetical protein